MVPFYPFYFEVIVIVQVVGLIIMIMNGWAVFQVLFVSFTKGPEGFPYVPIITGKVTTLIPINGITLVDHRVSVTGGDKEVFDGAATFEISLDAISTTDLFDTFTKILCVGYDNVALTLNFFSGSRSTCGTLIVNPINGLPGRPVESFLHLVQRSFRIFALGESFPEVVLLLFEQLRIAAHCLGPMGECVNDTKFSREVMVAIPLRYWSVWVGFLYTIMDRLPSTSGFTMVSKKGMEPSSLLSSTVNSIAGPTLLMCWGKSCLLTSLWMTKVSSTNLHQNLEDGGSA